MSLIHLSTELRQELKLTPQLLQSMELLQMNSQELLDYLNQVSEENPLVEQTDLSSLHKAYEALRQKVHWINGGLPEDGHGAMPDRGAADRETESLSAFLCDQLERRRLPKPLLALTRYLAELVDEEGRLSQEDLDGVADLKIPQALTQQALETLQSLDPAGVGARSLSECLLLQLARQDAPSPLDMEIVRRFLPDLGKKHYSLIARELHTTPEEVRAAEKRISALDPCPGRSFQPAEPTLYVRPDLFIAELDGKLQVILNDYYLPRVSISQYYVRLLKESDEPETRAYLQQKMQQAKWLLNSLERRGSTLRQCAEAILETQRAFFAGQTTELVPMTMVTLAERLHLHPSTVSRATREKYLQCRQGTYPLRYFFSRALGEQGPSQQTVKLRLLELIRQEDHSRPLSDQKLAELTERRDRLYRGAAALAERLSRARKERERDLLRPATAMQPPGRSIRFDDPRSAAAEQGIIKLLYLDPGLFRDRTNVPDAAQFSSPELRHIYTVLLAHGGTGTVQIAALSGELSPDELALLTGIIQQPAELANGARALDDYISILQTQATAGAASSEADLLAFAKQLKEHKGYGGKDGTERT